MKKRNLGGWSMSKTQKREPLNHCLLGAATQSSDRKRLGPGRVAIRSDLQILVLIDFGIFL